MTYDGEFQGAVKKPRGQYLFRGLETQMAVIAKVEQSMMQAAQADLAQSPRDACCGERVGIGLKSCRDARARGFRHTTVDKIFRFGNNHMNEVYRLVWG